MNGRHRRPRVPTRTSVSSQTRTWRRAIRSDDLRPNPAVGPAPRTDSAWHHSGGTVVRLANRLRDAAARHGCDRPVIPLTALATGILMLGAPPALGSLFLRRLADPAHSHETRGVWNAAADDYPYLSGSLRPLTGWLNDDPPDHQVKALAECLGVLTEFDLAAVAESPGVGGDLLGPVYGLLRGGRSRQRAGAFYTPPDLSALLAAITAPRPGDRVYEPACGTGGMVLAAVRSMRHRGLDPNSCTWTLNDLDPLAVALTGVNMATHGVRTVQLRCSDALTLAAHDRTSEREAEPHTDRTRSTIPAEPHHRTIGKRAIRPPPPKSRRPTPAGSA